MTDEELGKFIKTLFYTFDRVLVPKEVKEFTDAWRPYVGDFPYDIAIQLLPNICLGKEFPPRPWEIRVGIYNYLNSIVPPPTPQEAWAQYQEIMAAVTSGTSANINLHEALMATMGAMKGIGLNNQFDAKRFEELYKDKVNQWMKNTYWMGPKQ